MKIILLSGGSGKRLWPLSNDSRSKQFLRLLSAPDGSRESMIQRVVRQIRAAELTDDIVIATGANQTDSIDNQLGESIRVVAEPCRRDTFPAIMLACSYLKDHGTAMDEPVVVMPCDSYADDCYYTAVARMADAVGEGIYSMVLMGITPTYPSAKYGYIVPEIPVMEVGMEHCSGTFPVSRFVEKPDVSVAGSLVEEGALWNGGVFAFRLGYIMDIVNTVRPGCSFASLKKEYATLPKISFDYAVVEKADSVGVVPYAGKWKDLGTWNTLTDELDSYAFGNAYVESSDDTYVINELELPLVSLGAKGLVIAASPDGILVSERSLSENLKHIVGDIGKRPMYEERRWGEYKVIDSIEFSDGSSALTKQLTLRPGCSISYQKHTFRDEVWTIINGEGEAVLEGERKLVKRGDVIRIPKGTLHTLRALTPLSFIEVQQGSNLVEEDIERFEYSW